MYQRRQQVAKRLRFYSAVASAGFLAYLGCACEPLKSFKGSNMSLNNWLKLELLPLQILPDKGLQDANLGVPLRRSQPCRARELLLSHQSLLPTLMGLQYTSADCPGRYFPEFAEAR